ncbi:hypothetical protein [Chryseobacterium sp.]|uniref:hypothetical protein n=1 Tax=Chryseobacterium sp. TaxID=1871047 RepID=UPI0025B9BAF1|nr:hypothetical protein [Chryseobacterium sp.]
MPENRLKKAEKLNRESLKTVMGGHTCPNNLYHITWNGYHGCCIQVPEGNPCNSTLCLIPVEMCDSGIN